MQKSYNIPVLFIVFNRPKETQLVFSKIREMRPSRLYISSDGPRTEYKDEKLTVDTIREQLQNSIDWPCQVQYKLHPKNLGCKIAVSSAIDWFFQNEKMGVILEDDCLPNTSFFTFCESLLHRYENDKRIWHISGSNFQFGHIRGHADYYFSQFPHIWGWATWADRWQEYDIDLKLLSEDTFQKIFKNNARFYNLWFNRFKETKNGRSNTWDYQWMFTILINSGLSITPNKNLVSNIGFNEYATHTNQKNCILENISTKEFSNDEIKHPESIISDFKADVFFNANTYGIFPRIWRKIINYTKSFRFN